MKTGESFFEKDLDAQLERIKGDKVPVIINYLLNNNKLNALLEYTNLVSINRMGYNDHGKVHAKIVTINALKILDIIQGKIKTNLEKEKLGTFEDSKVVVILGSYLHDIGMSMGRKNHELHSALLAKDYIKEALQQLYNEERIEVYTALINECIVSHMANRETTSIESGITLIADGSDMTAGRSRIPLILEKRRGDIHKYSANAIASVRIEKGRKKTVKISIDMINPAGLFQIEQVLLPKLDKSLLKDDVEIEARWNEEKFSYR